MAIIISGNKEDQAEFKRLRETHELYDEFCNEWEFYLNSYEGGKDAILGNIFKHQRENREDYKDRVKFAHYMNYCSTVVDFFTTFIYGETIERNGGTDDDYYQKFLNDVNKKGDDVTKFMTGVCTDMQVFGFTYVLVDAPYIDPEVKLTKAEEEERGVRPYWVIVRPLEVLDWDVDEFGNYSYFKRMQTVYERDVFGIKRKYEKYTEWFLDKVIITYIDITQESKAFIAANKGSIVTNIRGDIPIVPFKGQQSRKYVEIGLSMLRDLAYNNREVLNITSLISEFLRKQCVVGSTLIECPRNLEEYPHGIPIKDLIGKEFLTYTWDIKDNRYTLKKAYDVRKTGEQKEVWRLKYTYKDEYNQDIIDHLDATPDHLILLQTGEYIPLRDLKLGDKLIPFYRWMDGHPYSKRVKRIPHILQDLSQFGGMVEHRFIVRECGEELIRGMEIHHTDGNYLNNEPKNLVQLSKKEHMKINAVALSNNTKKWWANASDEEKQTRMEKVRFGMAKWWHEGGAAVKARNKKQAKTIKETLAKLSAEERKAKLTNARLVLDPATSIVALRAGHKIWRESISTEEWKLRMAEMRKKINPEKSKQATRDFWKNLTVEQRQQHIAKMCAARFAKVNHSVLSVEFLGHEDVYNMEVEETNNYVANGIVIHNCFNVLAMEKETGIPLFDAKEAEIGTSNVITFPKGAKTPAYVSPPVDPAKFLQDERQRIITEMFKRAAQNLVSEFSNGEKSSGFSQAQSFSTTVPHIASRAETLEHGEYLLMEKTFAITNKTFNGVIHYKDRYEITNIADALTNLLIIFKDLVLPSETFAKEELKRIVHEFDGKLPPETLNKVYAEIDKMSYEEWINKVKVTKTSPGMQQKDKSTGTMKEIQQKAKTMVVGQTKKVRGEK